MIDRADWGRAKELFLAARELPIAERVGYLESVCNGREELAAAVQRLLEESQASFLETPALGERFSLLDFDGEAESLTNAALPERVGPFVIRGLIGVGGMGIVYRAEQDSPRRQVALKVLRPGVATTAMVRRFEHEAELLGRLAHPGIARIFDAGTADEGHGAQPWLAMEWIRGVSLTEHAGRARLGVRERLELMAKVCDAIQHAHQMGVVHRDLKPANILVDESGAPKVLDFGVARPTANEPSDSSWRTAFGQLVGTLPYMSPEQVSGDPTRIDTRTDVYALGAVTYELLCGEPPIDLSGLSVPEAARAVDERQPRALAERCPGIARDVETIVAKALEKDRDSRYSSAAALAADLRQYLADEPIAARPPSTIEQLRRFSRKNRALVGWAAATLFAVVLAFVGTVSGLARTIAARDVAAREAQRAGAVRDYLVDLMRRADPAREGRDVRLREVLETAAGELDDVFADEPLIRGELRHSLGKTFCSLGEFESSEVELREAVRLFTLHAGALAVETLEARGDLGTLWLERGQFDAAVESLRATWRDDVATLGPTHRQTLMCQNNLGLALLNAGSFDEAKVIVNACLELRERHLGLDDADTLLSRSQRARLTQETGDFEGAVRQHEECLSAARRVLGERHPRTLTQMNNFALALGQLGERERARDLFAETLRLRREVLGSEHPDTVQALGNLATMHSLTGDHERALELALEAMDIRQRVLGEAHPRTLVSTNNVAECLKDLGRSGEAEELFHSVLESADGALPAGHWHRALFRGNLGRFLWSEERFDEAEPYLLECYDGLLETFGAEHGRVHHHEERLEDFYRAWGDSTEAEYWRVKHDGN